MKYGVEWRRGAKNLLLTVTGTLILAFGTAVFILPFDLVAGGVSGLAIIVDRYVPLPFLTVDLTVMVLTWVLFFAGLLFLGRAFAAKTLVSSVVYPIGISLFLRLVDPRVLGGFFDLRTGGHADIALILAAAFGGVLVGAGCAITFLGGGSTGGMDIVAFALCKLFKRWKSSVVIFVIDAGIILLGAFAVGDFAVTLLGILSAFISAVVVDKVFLGGSRAFVAQIVTENYEAVNREVIERLERTTTLLDAVGGYSGTPRRIVMVSFSMRQYNDLIDIINRCDKNAFVTIHQAHEINGEGWTR